MDIDWLDGFSARARAMLHSPLFSFLNDTRGIRYQILSRPRSNRVDPTSREWEIGSACMCDVVVSRRSAGMRKKCGGERENECKFCGRREREGNFCRYGEKGWCCRFRIRENPIFVLHFLYTKRRLISRRVRLENRSVHWLNIFSIGIIINV